MPSSVKRTRARLYLTLRFLFLTFGPWFLHLLVADLGLSLLLLLVPLFPTYANRLASTIAQSIWHGVQRICVERNGAVITVAGDELPRGESAIVVANHIEWSDFYLVQALAIRAGMLGHCRWFAKKQLKYVPLLGWGLWAMGMPLVDRNWAEDKEELERLFNGIRVEGWPVWLISYSEGTRYTSKKYAEAVRWCETKGKPAPRHTLYPRTKGFVATVQQLRKAPHVKAVYDLTIAYAEGNKFMAPPSFFETLYQPNLAQKHRIYVHVRRFELSALPHTEAEIAQWLEDKWIEKGQRMAALKKQLDDGEPWKGVEIEDCSTHPSSITL